MPLCLISLGSNVGDRRRTLDNAVEAIGSLPVVRILAASDWLASQPVGGPAEQGGFLNGVVQIETEAPAEQLLEQLQAIESNLGRVRDVRWDARTLDLDLLLYGEQVIKTDVLRVPHPRMTFRPFVMQPAVEIASQMQHPELQATLAQIYRTAGDDAGTIRIVGDQSLRLKATQLLINQSDAFDECPSASAGETWLRIQGLEKRDLSATPRLQVTVDADSTLWPATPVLPLQEMPTADWPAELAAAVACLWPALG